MTRDNQPFTPSGALRIRKTRAREAGEGGGVMATLPPGGPAPAQPRPKAVRAVVEAVPARAGCTELRLECGHSIRRRLSFCPPTRIVCPECSKG